jgi:parvulin-like peptidyl-prolyl cis-trans isomerase-like protein
MIPNQADFRHATRAAGCTRAGWAPLCLIASLCLLFAKGALAASPPPGPGPIATMGNRTVDAVDIQRAAEVLASDPLKKKNPTQWRRMLLDRCVDRELLAMEAERRGIADEPAVRQKIAEQEFLHLYQIVHQRVLDPTVEPTSAQLDSLRGTGLYRMVDLHYILLRDGPDQARRKEAESIVARLRQGARSKSGHPSRGSGGHFGSVLVRDLDPSSYPVASKAKAGDIIGPFSGPYGHEIYKAGGFEDLTEDSLKSLVRIERRRNLVRNYQARLLAQYHFTLDSTMARSVLFAAGYEPVDTILASLGRDGTRQRRGAKPALGVFARVDGDSLDFPGLVREARPAAGEGGRLRIRDLSALQDLASQAFFRRLVVRDAKDRGLADDARVARELRLIRDGVAVRTMVERARPPVPDPAKLQAWFDAHASRYRMPPARRARVAVFAEADSAMAALRSWNGVGISDSSLTALGFTPQPRATPETLFPKHTATLDFIDRASDPLSLAVRSLGPGMVSPMVRTLQGYAVAHVVSREPERPMTLDESIDRVRRDWREEKENEWVQTQLERIRASTPVKVVPARLDAVKLATPSKGGSVGSVEVSR